MTGSLPDALPGDGARIDVVVPARDEEDRIGACLDALEVARGRLHDVAPDVDVRITVVVDASSDRTLDIARRHAAARRATDRHDRSRHDSSRHDDPGPDRSGAERIAVLEVRTGSVGPARLAGVRDALSYPGPPRRWIANTDADSRVPPGWLIQQAAALADGIDVLVGAVVPDPADLTPETLRRWRAAHPVGATLGHVHGANLGLRADVYERIGGFLAVPEHEDVALVAAARSIAARVVATEAMPVVTSGRTIGRTPGGYAQHLRDTYAS